MVAPVPAQITKLRPCLHAAAPRRALLTTYHSPPTLFLPPSSASLSANISPVLNSFRILPVATGVYHSSFPTSDFQMRLLHPDASTGPPGMPSLLFASACCLFVVSLHSFLPSLPLFSIVWSLFPQNTRGGGALCCALTTFQCSSTPTPLFLITSLQTQHFHAITHSFAQRHTNIPTILNSLRTLSIATGGGTLCDVCVPHSVPSVLRFFLPFERLR